MDWVTSRSSRRRWPGFTPFAPVLPGFGADWGHLALTALLGPRAPGRPGRREHAGPAGQRRGPGPLARAAAGGGRGSRRLRPCCPDVGRIGAIWHLRHCLGPGPRRGRAGVNTRARRVGGAARGPWRVPQPAVAGVHAVCARAARIWGGLGPFGTHGPVWPWAPERPGRREHAGPAGRRRGRRNQCRCFCYVMSRFAVFRSSSKRC